MNRENLERFQVWVYLCAIVLGLLLGLFAPDLALPLSEALLWPVLAVLLGVTFMQTPLWHLREALRDARFAAATVLGNFVLVPLVVWWLVELWGLQGPLRLGVLLVLLTPCTDWFITFSQLGRADVLRAVTVTPLNLLLQLLLLPLYLWGMGEGHALPTLDAATLWPVLGIVGVPLAVAALAQRVLEQRPAAPRVLAALAWWPVPLLALVVALIAAGQVQAMARVGPELLRLLPLYTVYLMLAAALAVGLARWMRLPTRQGRTLAFSLGTRNSFVVLPLALALPPGWEAAALAIVLQSLVELLGMMVFVWAVPAKWLPDRASTPAPAPHL